MFFVTQKPPLFSDLQRATAGVLGAWEPLSAPGESPSILHHNELHLRKAAPREGRQAVFGEADASCTCGNRDTSPALLLRPPPPFTQAQSHASCGRGSGVAAFPLPKPKCAYPQQEILQNRTLCGQSLYLFLKGRGWLNHYRAGDLFSVPEQHHLTWRYRS